MQSGTWSQTLTVSAAERRWGKQQGLRSTQGTPGAWTGSKTSEKRDDVVAFSSPESLIHQRTVFWEGLTQQQKDQVVTRGISWPQEVL